MSKKDKVPRLEPGETPKLVEFPLDRFLLEKALWACNYFVLWPIGLALTATVDVDDATGELVRATKLDVREYSYPDGASVETIDQSNKENKADYEVFLHFVGERVGAMSKKERRLAISRLMGHAIANSDSIMLAAD